VLSVCAIHSPRLGCDNVGLPILPHPILIAQQLSDPLADKPVANTSRPANARVGGARVDAFPHAECISYNTLPIRTNKSGTVLSIHTNRNGK
jgi:hypothetical protein